MVEINKSLLHALLGGAAFTNFMTTYNLTIQIVLATVTILVILLLFVNIAKLSTASGNDRKRAEAGHGILVCLICVGLAGSIDTVYALLLHFVFGMGG